MKATQRTIAMSLVLLTAAAASAAPSRLTMNSGHDYCPHWDPTPGAVRIVYLTSNDVGIVNSNGTGEDILINGYSIAQTDDALAWVGIHLLFGDVDFGHEVYDYNTSTTGVTQLFSFQSGTTHVGAIASRGQTVVWRVGWNDQTKSQLRVDSHGDLVNDAPQLAQSGGDLVLEAPDGRIGARGMSLLPGGQQAIMSLPNGSLGGWDLFRIDTDPDGGLDDPVEITTTGETHGMLNCFPEVSPGGSQILFSRADSTDNQIYDLFLMNVNGSGLTNLTNSPGVDERSPTWSPNGQDYAFQRLDEDLPGESNNWNIYVDEIPEPATLILMATGLPLLLRRKRKSR